MSRTNLSNFSKLDQINLMGSNNGCAVYRVRNSACFYALKVITIDPRGGILPLRDPPRVGVISRPQPPQHCEMPHHIGQQWWRYSGPPWVHEWRSLADRHITSESHLSNIASQVLSGIAYITTSNHPIFWLIMHKIASRLQILAWAKFFHNFWTQTILLGPSGTRVLKG